MKLQPKNRWYLVVAAVLFFISLVAGAYAEPVTRLSGVQPLHSLKKFYSIPNFKIGGEYEFGNEAAYEFGGKGGVTLESLGQEPLRTAYIAVGTPKRNGNGKIINAVVISPYYSGDSTFDYFFWYDGQKGNAFCRGAVVGPGKLIDTNKYYVIFVDALGLWGASKPSDGLGMKFPRYSTLDYVQANYRLLKDKLGVAKVKLATGVSMGAIQSYVWAILHPDYVEAIMPIGGMTAGDPVTRWLFQLMTAAMKSDPVWSKTKGDYYNLPKEKHPNKGMMFGWSVLGQSGLSFDFRNKQKWDVVKKDVFYWEPKADEGTKLVKKGIDYDVNDLLYRNQTIDTYDINDQLHRIKAKTLIIHVKNDQWLRYKMAKEAAKKIKGAKLVGFESPLAHYAVFRGPNMVMIEVIDFLKKIDTK
ncbi:MAG: alpha/beta fold hydrolase [Deltaproteobacteria bacterium]|nr:alpha/beta fold hydrolase [Deltaproteobacteria bacterium]